MFQRSDGVSDLTMCYAGGDVHAVVHNMEADSLAVTPERDGDVGGMSVADTVSHALSHETEDIALFFPRENLKSG